MKLKLFLTLQAISTALFLLSWIAVLWKVDPTTTNMWGYVLFYFTFVFACSGVFLFFALGFLRVFSHKKMNLRIAVSVFRQSIWLSIMITVLLFFLSQRLLTWWNCLILLSAMILMEVLFIRLRREYIQDGVSPLRSSPAPVIEDKDEDILRVV